MACLVAWFLGYLSGVRFLFLSFQSLCWVVRGVHVVFGLSKVCVSASVWWLCPLLALSLPGFPPWGGGGVDPSRPPYPYMHDCMYTEKRMSAAGVLVAASDSGQGCAPVGQVVRYDPRPLLQSRFGDGKADVCMLAAISGVGKGRLLRGIGLRLPSLSHTHSYTHALLHTAHPSCFPISCLLYDASLAGERRHGTPAWAAWWEPPSSTTAANRRPHHRRLRSRKPQSHEGSPQSPTTAEQYIFVVVVGSIFTALYICD